MSDGCRARLFGWLFVCFFVLFPNDYLRAPVGALWQHSFSG